MVRSISNDKPGLTLAMNIIATAQGVIVDDDIVKISTSSNWAVNTTAASDDLVDCGIVRHVAADSKTCTVEFFHFHDCIELTNSGTHTPALGSQVCMGATAKCNQVVTSGIAGTENIVVNVGTSTCHVLFR